MTKNVQELHKEYNKYSDILKLQLVHRYDSKLKVWEFQGYRCRHCDTVLQYATTIQKHPITCKELNKTTKRVITEPIAILTVDNKIWKPLDFSSNGS